MYKPKVCLYCDETFTPTSPNQQHCCKEHYYKYRLESRKKEKPTMSCLICGKVVTQQYKNQHTCGSEDCREKYVAIYGRAHKCKFDVPDKPAVRKRRMSKARWNALTPSERWERMPLAEVNEEALKFGMDYGDSQSACYNGTLPKDFGKRG